MMNILEKIVSYKRKEVDLKKSLIPISHFEKSLLFEWTPISLCKELKKGRSGIIAEHKRRSPSKEVINQKANLKEVVKGYENAGVSGISVLTDSTFFGGSLDDLLLARAAVQIPLLRKDFIIDEYQIVEAKAHGADVILLIASILQKDEIKSLSELARSLGLEVLMEIHNETELKKAIMPSLDMIGVNNRNLKTFEVNLNTSKSLAEMIPPNFIKVSESGISTAKAIKELSEFGFQGFLIGEHFMKNDDPGDSARQFIKSLN